MTKDIIADSPPQWTKEPPTVPWHYWVWQPAEDWPSSGEVTAIRFYPGGPGKLIAQFKCYDLIDPFGANNIWQSALWLGPIAAPAPPTKEQL